MAAEVGQQQQQVGADSVIDMYWGPQSFCYRIVAALVNIWAFRLLAPDRSYCFSTRPVVPET